ncbi:MAG: cell division protein FtsL [Gammaproteobacteria bacterium]|nr:cell division protein FtsL [Gammaproteobacteria bacterium]NIN62845.1 cell division protein FtsL [Gammaproteobacteria bacterium]NIO63826.1 cell division protein FtsL [Gammaproteobacteria bacterium]NIP50204.1 cell division protein FtsL [Gammaproteobacteria bacterium]NIQ12422.1 cell division protein FtsL [Gammaproteobacteria bacterium]
MKNLFFASLVLAVFISALFVVVAQNKARVLFVEIQELESERNRLNEDWTRLLLEQSTWATDARVEEVARGQLDMKSPDNSSLVVIKQ